MAAPLPLRHLSESVQHAAGAKSPRDRSPSPPGRATGIQQPPTSSRDFGRHSPQSSKSHNDDYPFTIFYAFKQAETNEAGTASTGWETMLEGLLDAGGDHQRDLAHPHGTAWWAS